MSNLVSVGECEPSHHWLSEEEVGHCPLALAWSTASEPSACTLYLGYNKESAEFVPICSPFPFLLFHGKNNRIVRRDPRSFSGITDNLREHRTCWYFQISLETEAWVLENMGGVGKEILATGARLEDGIHSSWTLTPGK